MLYFKGGMLMKFKNYFLGALLALMGLVMLIWPGFCIKIVVILAGLATVATGIYNLAKTTQVSEEPVYRKTTFIKNIISIVIGVIAVVCPLLLMKSAAFIWTVITYILAIYFVIYAILGFVISSYTKDLESEIRKRITTESIIFLLIAVILFVLPIGAVIETIIRIAGAVAIVVGAIFIIREILYSKKTKSVK